MKKGILNSAILFILFSHGLTLWAQENRMITGRVTTFGVIPLNNVEIKASKSGEETVTDSEGFFSIRCEEKDMIRAYASGFDFKKAKIRKTDSVHIDLVYSNTDRSMADATTNGHISRNALEDAMKKYPLKGEKDYSRYSDIYELIKTEIYNVNVSGTSITTTKPSSLTSGQEVLLVVDGIIHQDISFLVPSDVRSLRYFDGPEAARYGVRGGNGVIEITTRR